MNIAFFENLGQPEVMLYIVIFFGVLIIFDGARQIAIGQSNEGRTRNRRMRMIAKGIDEEKIAEKLLRYQPASGKRTPGLIGRFRRNFARANVPFGLGTLLTISLALFAGIFLLALGWLSKPAALALALGLGFCLPYAIVNRMAEARVEKLAKQLPDALEMMARGLRVGHPLNVTLRRVARDMPDPIGSEFGIVEDRTRHGVDLVTAFKELADRIDCEDVHYLSVCVGIQHGTGGNLARVLLVLSQVIRGRLTMRKKIHAISSEGRMSGMILTAMPFIIIGTVHASTPSFFLDVMDHPIFMPVALIVLALIVFQALILHRLTNFDF